MRSGSSPVEQPTVTLLEDLARRYYKPLLSFFRKRTHNAPEVRDLVQQVFLRLAQYPGLEGIQNAEGYVFKTAANTLRDHYRREAVHGQLFDLPRDCEAGVDSDFPPERVLQGQETLVRVTDALRQLPERTRDIFMLRWFEGLKHAEIAHLHGISIRAVEKHAAKALVHLSKALDIDAGGEL